MIKKRLRKTTYCAKAFSPIAATVLIVIFLIAVGAAVKVFYSPFTIAQNIDLLMGKATDVSGRRAVCGSDALHFKPNEVREFSFTVEENWLNVELSGFLENSGDNLVTASVVETNGQRSFYEKRNFALTEVSATLPVNDYKLIFVSRARENAKVYCDLAVTYNALEYR